MSTVRSGEPLVAYIRGVRKGKQPYPDLVVLSPGPGNPGDFGLSDTIREVRGFLRCGVVGVYAKHFHGTVPLSMYALRASCVLLFGDVLRQTSVSFARPPARPPLPPYVLCAENERCSYACTFTLFTRGKLFFFAKAGDCDFLSRDAMGIEYSTHHNCTTHFT